jgi:lysophospholipid acyltransferase (LPLAT)-like uncharacterized protein
LIRKYLLGFLAWFILRSLIATWKMRIFEPESMQDSLKKKESLILAHWHGDELALIYLFTKYPIATITSTSKDGEIMDLVVRWLGGKTSRGSSTRGAVGALKGLLKIVKDEGCCSSFAVDGPKGPIYQVKPGVFEISRLMKAPIYYAGVSTDRAWRFPKAWNKTYLPKPFATVEIRWAGPIAAINKEQDPRSEELAKTLADALHNARAEAAKKIAAPI